MNRPTKLLIILNVFTPTCFALLVFVLFLLTPSPIHLQPATASPLPRHRVQFNPPSFAQSAATARRTTSKDDKSFKLTVMCANGAYTMPALEIGVIKQLAGLKIAERVNFLQELCREARELSFTTSSPAAAHTTSTTAAVTPSVSDSLDPMSALSSFDDETLTSAKTRPFRVIPSELPSVAELAALAESLLASSDHSNSLEIETSYNEELPESFADRPTKQKRQSNHFSISHRKLRKRQYCMLFLKFLKLIIASPKTCHKIQSEYL